MSTPGGGGGGAADKTRLSDSQKKANHIESEKKRRLAIREGFDKLAEIVPGMVGQGRSEAVVLQATVEFLREQLSKKEQLRAMAKKKGWTNERFEATYGQISKVAREAEAEGS